MCTSRTTPCTAGVSFLAVKKINRPYNFVDAQLRSIFLHKRELKAVVTTTPRATPSKKMNLYFPFEFRSCLYLFNPPNGLKRNTQRQHSVPNKNTTKKRSPKCAELIHFTLLFRKGRQRNVQRFTTHVQSYCFAH